MRNSCPELLNYLPQKNDDEAVQLLAEGLRNRRIAARLGLSANKVTNYIFRIF
jgi:DNA-binding CsgD family transcriptional regulator